MLYMTVIQNIKEAWDEMSQVFMKSCLAKTVPHCCMEFQVSRKSSINENGEIKHITCEAVTGGVRASNMEDLLASHGNNQQQEQNCHVVFKEQEHEAFLQNCWLPGLLKRHILCIISVSLSQRSKTMTSHKERLQHVAVTSCLTVIKTFCEPSKESYIVNPGLLFQA